MKSVFRRWWAGRVAAEAPAVQGKGLAFQTFGGIALAAIAGLSVVLRTAGHYAETDRIAYLLVWTIGIGLVGGLAELVWRTRHCLSLYEELQSLPTRPDAHTLERVSPALRTWLQARLERAPAPPTSVLFTPYLVGLLVMLGLLGTFLGLFDTLRGARDALTAGGDIEALRAGLAHPMAGLTRSFGSSAAGISASALLGFAAVFVRRVESKVGARVHAYAAGPLQHLSPFQRQHEALIALSQQGEAMPEAARALSGLGERLDAMAARWEQAHSESARGMQQALETAVRTARTDLERAAGQSAQRLHDQVAPLLTGALEDLRARQSEQLDALSQQGAAQVQAHAALTAQVHEQLTSAAERFAAAVEQMRERDIAHQERAEGALAGLEKASAALTESLGTHKEQLGELIATSGTQLTELAAASAEGASSTLEALRQHAEAQAERLSSYAQALHETQSQSAQALDQRLEAQAARMAEGLGQSGQTVAEAADLLRASGAELSAVAEMFAASVESQREAAGAWLENLGELEGAIEQTGREAAADALGEQLASTQEIFARQLQFQRELFEQLQSLRPDASARAHEEDYAHA